MNAKSFFILLIIYSLFTNCNKGKLSPEPLSLSGTWKLTDISIPSESKSDEKDKLLSEAVGKTLLEKGVTYCFFPDGSGAEMFSESYKAINWEFLPEQSSIVISSGNHDTLLLEGFQEKDKRQHLTLKHSKTGSMEFIKVDTILKSYKEDPFYPSNNTWRVKSTKKESEQELKMRLKNFVGHYCYILKAAKERNSEIISFSNSQGIIKIFNGGIGVVEEQHIPDEWMDCFFDSEQAYQTYYCFEKYVQETDFNGVYSGSWVNDDYNILLALYKTIDEDLNKTKASVESLP